MNVEDINVGDEVSVGRDLWFQVTYIEGELIVGRRLDNRQPIAYKSEWIDEVRHPKTPLGYEPVYNGADAMSWTNDLDDLDFDSDATHVVTHWSDGTCTLDTIAAFREAHQ